MNMAEFERCSPYIQAALKYSGGTHDLDDVRREIEQDRLQFWPGVNSAVVTEIQLYPKLKACNFFLAGGNMEELRGMCQRIEQWSKSIGCTRMLISGRMGWVRTFLTKDGYKLTWAVLAKELV